MGSLTLTASKPMQMFPSYPARMPPIVRKQLPAHTLLCSLFICDSNSRGTSVPSSICPFVRAYPTFVCYFSKHITGSLVCVLEHLSVVCVPGGGIAAENGVVVVNIGLGGGGGDGHEQG